MRLIDLTRVFDEPMPCYPGDPPFSLRCTSTAQASGWTHYHLSCGMHTGTHIDAPLHRFTNGKSIADFPLQRFYGRGRLIDARGRDVIDADVLAQQEIQPNDIVLFITGMAAKFHEPDYFTKHPVLSSALAEELVRRQVSIAGIDSPSPDREPFAVHEILLGAGVLILENLLNLEQLIGVPDFEVIALPAKFRAEAAPVRVAAKVCEMRSPS
ncbi:MAG TPA: cyclase family protein [Oligoflexia bacterium]|nr:cyclase family protein [Oligoflexia bacterium]